MSKAGPGFISNKVVPIVIGAAITFNVLASPFFKAQAQDSTLSKRAVTHEQAETAPKSITPAEQARQTMNAIRQDVFYRLRAEPVLATLPREEISTLLGALFTPRRSQTPILLKLSKTMYDNGLPIVGSNGQHVLRERVELQNALSRLSGYLLFEWGIDRLDMVVTEPVGASHFQIFIDCSAPFPAQKELMKAAGKNGLLK